MSEEQLLQVNFVLERPQFRLDVALELPLRGITGVFGASGAGKTSLLRCIAGLEQPTVGTLIVGGDVWEDTAGGVSLAVHEREVGYVFQEPRLFRHLDVRGNLKYGSGRGGANASKLDFDRVVNILGLGKLLDRMPADVSGGEAQRVAIGRALLRAPKLILMDEPLASLDAARKYEILPFLERLHAESSTPILYVSHNIEEVCRLCDHLVVIDDGSVAADGELQSVLVSMEVSQLSGDEAGAVIIGEVAGYDTDYDLTSIAFAGGKLQVPGVHGDVGSQVRVRIRASDISLCRQRPTQTTILNILGGAIEEMQDADGASRLIRLRVGGALLLARVTRRSCDELNLQPGDAVEVQIKAVAVRGY